MILSPFTNWVLQYFPIGPFWLLELAELLVVIGLILALTDKATTIGLITAITRALTGSNKNFSVGVSPGFARRIGIALILVGLAFSTAAIDGIASTPSFATYLSTGGPSFTPCPTPFQNLPCYQSGGAGISCSSTVPSPCWTQVQNGTKTCTVNVGQTSCTAAVTFSPAYSLSPQGSVNFVTGTVAASVSQSFTSPVQTTLFFQADNNTNWKLIPASDTELYGKTNQRLQWTTPSSWSAQTAQFCIDVSNTTSIDSPVIWPQFATSLAGPWTNMGDASFRITPAATGFQCGFLESIALTASTLYYFRVVGNDANGFNPGIEPDDLGLGLIELYMTGSFTNTLGISVGCTTTILTAPTKTSMTVGATCGTQGISAQKIFTINWWAGIPA